MTEQTPKDRILKALRSGEYTKIVGRLRGHSPREFCAVGVICDIYMKEHAIEWEPIYSYDSRRYPMALALSGEQAAAQQAPQQIARWAFGSDQLPSLWWIADSGDIDCHMSIDELNDQGELTFEDIADLIEDQL